MEVECSNYTSPFSDKIYSIIPAVTAVVGFFSLLASLFTIFVIILFKQHKIFNQRLILYLAITTAMFSVCVVIQRVDYQQETGKFYTGFCVFSGFLNQVSSWMILSAVTCITLSLIIRAFFQRDPESLDKLSVLLIFVFPFTFNWIPFIREAYGKSGAWCWIRSLDKCMEEVFLFGKTLQLVLWYIPLYLVILVQIVLFVLVTVKLFRYKKYSTIGEYVPYNRKDQQELIKEAMPMLSYPVIYFIVNIFPLVNRIYGYINPTSPSPVIWFLSGIFLPLIGILVALAYCLDPQNRRRLNRANFREAFTSIWSGRRYSVFEYSIPKDCTSDSFKRESQYQPESGQASNQPTEKAHKALTIHEEHPSLRLSPKRTSGQNKPQ